MNMPRLPLFLRSDALSELERIHRRDQLLALVLFGLIGLFLLFGTVQAIDTAYAAPLPSH
ncbi:MAG TPA: hypothetical protein VJ548_06810 [Azospira sp.]|nr:hypothetical protein [Azospira sp.]